MNSAKNKENLLKKTKVKKVKSSLFSSVLANVLALTIIPAYSVYSYSKFFATLPFLPLLWTIKKMNPHIVEDISKTKNKLKNTVKTTADKSFKTAGSYILKYFIISTN